MQPGATVKVKFVKVVAELMDAVADPLSTTGSAGVSRGLPPVG